MACAGPSAAQSWPGGKMPCTFPDMLTHCHAFKLKEEDDEEEEEAEAEKFKETTSCGLKGTHANLTGPGEACMAGLENSET